MKTEAWTLFISEIRAACKRLKCGQGEETEAWFRGTSDMNHELLPSLFRYFGNRENKKIAKRIWEVESDMFWEFSARGKELHGAIETDWDILFAMQHYGAPTRLLDWTEVLGVAVYFAIVKYEANITQANACPCVWILNPYELNRFSVNPGKKSPPKQDLFAPENLGWDEEEREYYSYGELLSEGMMFWDRPIAIYPKQRNPRIHAQRAWFTIHGDEYVPIEKIPGNERYLQRVNLPLEAIASARDFLKDAGIDHYLLFSDLASLCLHLKEKNGLCKVNSVSDQKTAKL